MAQWTAQASSRKRMAEVVCLLLFAGWTLFYFYMQLESATQFYGISDGLVFLVMAGVYGFFSLFLLDFSDPWLYLPWAVLNGALALFQVVRLTWMFSAGALATALNVLLLCVPLALFAVLILHVRARREKVGAI